MAAQPYRPSYWTDDEPTYTKKLNVMSANDQWLFENMPRVQYNAYGIRRNEGCKIATGTALFPPFKDNVRRTVEFGTFFSTACKPVVVLGGVNATYGRINVISQGIDLGQPDHRGFHILAYSTIPNNRMGASFYVPWIAIGF